MNDRDYVSSALGATAEFKGAPLKFFLFGDLLPRSLPICHVVFIEREVMAEFQDCVLISLD